VCIQHTELTRYLNPAVVQHQPGTLMFTACCGQFLTTFFVNITDIIEHTIKSAMQVVIYVIDTQRYSDCYP
jgi:hypothetical protein